MKIRWLLQACIVVAVGMGLVSCTKAEIEQAMNRPAEIMLQSSPCQPAGIASTATPEFCINVMEIHLTSHDTQADVSLTLVNRTGRRHFIYVSGMPSMIDSSGAKWIGRRHTGLGSGTHYPVTVEPNVETQGSITFYQSGQATTDLTFSLRGEIAIMQVDSRGQPIPFKIAVTRGFNISGIRLPQPPPQSSAPIEPKLETKLAQVSPQGVAPATPKVSASSQSSAPVAVAGASGSGNPSSQKPASPNASGSGDQKSNSIGTPATAAPTSNSGSKSVGSGGPGPDVIGLRIGMGPDESRTILKSRFGASVESVNERLETLKFMLPSGSQAIQNTKYLGSIIGKTSDMSHYITVMFSPNPKEEGVVFLQRHLQLLPSNKPTLAAFEKTLMEKYGTPTENELVTYTWRYDSSGKLLRPAPSKNFGSCPQLDPNQLSINYYLTTTIFNPPHTKKLQQFKESMSGCGSILIRVDYNAEAYPPGRNELINSYNTTMIGFDAIIQSFDAAKGIIDKARAEASGAAIKQGQQQKPDL